MNKKLEKLHELRKDRSLIPSHVVGFLKAYQSAARLHQFLATDAPNSSPEVISSALAHLQVFSVCALETLFRDCFITLCQRDPDFLQHSSAKEKIDYALAQKLTSDSVGPEERLAAQRNFQNLKCVNEVFSPFLGKPLFSALEEKSWSVFTVGLKPGTPFNFTLSEIDPNWFEIFSELFESRHQLIHNAHRPLPTNQEQVVKQCTIALVIGQLVGILISERFQVGTLTVEVPFRAATVHMVGMVASAAKTKPTAVQLKAAFDSLQRNKELDDAPAYLGPFMFFGAELMQTTFSTSQGTQELVAAGRSVVHLVRHNTPSGFVLDTLLGMEEAQDQTPPIPTPFNTPH